MYFKTKLENWITGAYSKQQCFGSGLDPDSIKSVDPYPDPDPGGQNDRQKYKKLRNFHVLKCLMISMRAEGWIQIRIGIQP
jgi:hypothetical protein